MEDVYSTQLKEKDPVILLGMKVEQDKEEDVKSAFPVLKFMNTCGPPQSWCYIKKYCNHKVLTVDRNCQFRYY